MASGKHPGKWRAAWLSRSWMVTGTGEIRPTPAGWDGDGIGGLLTRLAPLYTREGVLMLDESAAALLSLPTDPAAVRQGRQHAHLADHPAVADAARAGWSTSGIGDWSTFTSSAGPGSVIHVAVVPLLDLTADPQTGYVRDFPLWGRWPQDTVSALDLWQRVTGTAWHGGPGVAGTSVFTHCFPRGERASKPTLKPTGKDKRTGQIKPFQFPPREATEHTYAVRQWRNEQSAGRWQHGYDANRAFVGSMITLKVCPWTLQHTGRVDFDKTRAGWWMVELAPWILPHMPDPAGYVRGNNRVRPISHPTAILLAELAEQGVYGGFTVLDSFTGSAKEWPMRPYGERLRDAYALVDVDSGEPLSDVDPGDAAQVRRAVKDAGRRTPGMWASESNFISRFDWHHALTAQDRANRWRMMWTIGQQEGRWPVAIDVDHIFYTSDDPDPMSAAPAYLRGTDRHGRPRLDPTGQTLGGYKPKSTMPNRAYRPVAG